MRFTFSAIGALGGLCSIVAVLGSMVAYSTDRWFDPLRQPVSDLGWGPNGSGAVFRSGMTLSGLAMLVYAVGASRIILKQYADRVSRSNTAGDRSAPSTGMVEALLSLGVGAFFAGALGIGVVVAFPNQHGRWLVPHLVGAAAHIACTVAYTVAFTAAMLAAEVATLALVLAALAMITTGCLVATAALSALLSFKLPVLAADIAATAPWFPMSELAYALSTGLYALAAAAATAGPERKRRRR
jgi:hypothetical protein